MDAPAEAAVVVMARLPNPGFVKTRLAASVGNEGAALFYQSCAEAVIRELGRLPNFQVYVFYSRGEDEAAVAAWLAPLEMPRMRLEPQLDSPDLGDRMRAAMCHAFAAGHRRVAIVGTDIPDLRAALVLQALAALDTHQVVFGPAEDGGYWLLGLATAPSEELFQGIEWSTPSVLASNIANARRLHLQVAPLSTLPCLPDIDTIDDLRRWCSRRQQQRAGSQAEDSLLTMALQVAASAAESPA